MAQTQTPADLKVALDRAMQDPKVAAAAKAYTAAPKGGHNATGTGGAGVTAYNDFFTSIKPYLPPGYHAQITQSGEPSIVKDGLPGWVYPLAAAAIAITVGAAAGGFAAAAPAAAGVASGGAGVAAPAAATGITGQIAAGAGANIAPSVAGATGFGVPAAAATAPATNLLSRIGQGAGDASTILGGAAASESAANSRESQYNLNEDQLNLDRFKTDQALPGQRLNTAVKASRVANITPAKFEWGGPGSVAAGQMPHYTGGDMNPDLINQDTKDLANNVSHQALLDQMNGVASPKATPYKPPTTTGRVIGAGATGASILSRILHWL